jgi:hypothetical protein
MNKGVKTSYADVLATARQKVPLAEIGVESLGMRKSMTGGIIIRLPGDEDRGKRHALRREPRGSHRSANRSRR